MDIFSSIFFLQIIDHQFYKTQRHKGTKIAEMDFCVTVPDLKVQFSFSTISSPWEPPGETCLPSSDVEQVISHCGALTHDH